VDEQGRTLDLHDGETAGLAIVAGGVVVIVLGWIAHSRVLRVGGFLAAAAGSGLYARTKIAERSEKIDAAESHIRSELDDLDPIGKAEVIAKLTQPPE
jgi:hypothetical protein